MSLGSILDQLDHLVLNGDAKPTSKSTEQNAALLALSKVPGAINDRVRLFKCADSILTTI